MSEKKLQALFAKSKNSKGFSEGLSTKWTKPVHPDGKADNSNIYVMSVFLGVLEEAEFYNIDPLVRIIKERIDSREARLKHPVSYHYLGNVLLYCKSLNNRGTYFKFWIFSFKFV